MVHSHVGYGSQSFATTFGFLFFTTSESEPSHGQVEITGTINLFNLII